MRPCLFHVQSNFTIKLQSTNDYLSELANVKASRYSKEDLIPGLFVTYLLAAAECCCQRLVSHATLVIQLTVKTHK